MFLTCKNPSIFHAKNVPILRLLNLRVIKILLTLNRERKIVCCLIFYYGSIRYYWGFSGVLPLSRVFGQRQDERTWNGSETSDNKYPTETNNSIIDRLFVFNSMMTACWAYPVKRLDDSGRRIIACLTRHFRIVTYPARRCFYRNFMCSRICMYTAPMGICFFNCTTRIVTRAYTVITPIWYHAASYSPRCRTGCLHAFAKLYIRFNLSLRLRLTHDFKNTYTHRRL